MRKSLKTSITLATTGALVLGGAAFGIDALIPAGSIPLDISPRRVILSAALLLVAAIVGCGFSLRRVLRVDPAAAIGTAS